MTIVKPRPIRCGECGHKPVHHDVGADSPEVAVKCVNDTFAEYQRQPCMCRGYLPAHKPWIPPAELLRVLKLDGFEDVERFAWCSWEAWLAILCGEGNLLLGEMILTKVSGSNYQDEPGGCLICRKDWSAFADLLRKSCSRRTISNVRPEM